MHDSQTNTVLSQDITQNVTLSLKKIVLGKVTDTLRR
jgi:hypothetical protein